MSVPVEKLNAQGKAPIALALRESANAIAGATPASIVLVADDLDNCGQDICAAIGQILGSSPNLVVHTIALGFDKPKLEQISCIAQQTGGKLWDAQDAAGFASALSQAVNLANLQSAPSAPTPEPAAGEAAAEKPAGAPPGSISRPGSGRAVRRSTVPCIGASPGPAPTGRWCATPARRRCSRSWSPGPTTSRRGSVSPARARRSRSPPTRATPVRIDLNGGVLQHAGARRPTRPPPLTAPIFTVTPASADAAAQSAPLWVGREAHPEIVLPAGDYIVTAQNGVARQQSKVTIAPATGTNFNSMLESGSLELSATRGTAAVPGEPVTEGVTFILSQDDPDAPQGRREVARSAAPAPSFTLPAGTYYVTARTPSCRGARADRHRRRRCRQARHAAVAGAHQARRHARWAAGHRGQARDLPRRAPRREPREVARTMRRSPSSIFPPAAIASKPTLGASNVIAATEIALAAGQAQKITLPLEGGGVTLKRDEAGATTGDVYWEVRDEKQRTVLRSSQPQPTAVLAPGRYIVSAETSEQPLAQRHRDQGQRAPHL